MAQSELRPVVEVVRQYGETNPGVIEQIWFEHSPQRVVALLAGNDLITHESALRALVSVPQHIEVKQSPWPPGHLERIREEIMETARDSMKEIGLGKGFLAVGLWADQADVAASLHRRYGQAVVLTVGYLPYPEIEVGNAAGGLSHQEIRELPALPEEEVSLSLEEDIVIRSGSHVSSTLSIRNESSFELVAGKLIPPIVDPTSGRVVGGYEGAITMELRRYEVPAGALQELPILIGTASSRPELGWAVPPGDWAIRIPFQLGDEGFQRTLSIQVVP
jgi:hypothetical protein